MNERPYNHNFAALRVNVYVHIACEWACFATTLPSISLPLYVSRGVERARYIGRERQADRDRDRCREREREREGKEGGMEKDRYL